jgi:hypothetical protein
MLAAEAAAEAKAKAPLAALQAATKKAVKPVRRESWIAGTEPVAKRQASEHQNCFHPYPPRGSFRGPNYGRGSNRGSHRGGPRPWKRDFKGLDDNLYQTAAVHFYEFFMRLKVHKNENFFGFDFEICTFS